ncbi:MAG: bifunctional (p)ppGpp synthetase/guanosine-3',5'-bis(diphosphate) 3'-pyrophosphohydrolase [Balneolaceae bacterium]|nr:bifunctional (p)ppGpp synthetase/guanosine-3',5'-bis(diphosphate) 3'-pyrophosphohydrolase [Balneolaceae bacterium]
MSRSSENNIIEKARIFATKAHASIDQRRKYTNEAYIVHPAEVARIVESVPHTDAMVAAAWLHDVVEDTPISLDVIYTEFGHEIGDLVEMLTDVSKPEDGNRKTRKAIDCQHTANASPEAKTIKLADIISNTSSIMEYDPGFAKVYLREKELLLEVLKEGDQTLWKKAKSVHL